MLRRSVLPIFLVLFALFSVVTLKSIEPTLVAKQAGFFVVGGVIFWLTTQLSFWRWQKLGAPLYGALIFLLLLTKVIGQATRGATSWIPIGSFHVQPSQLAVAWVGLFLCGWITTHPIRHLSQLLQFATIVGLPALLIFIQPELGTTVVYLAAMGSIFWLAPTKPRFLLGSLATVVLIAVVSWSFFLHGYQRDRILSYLNSSQQTGSASYNAQQALIAVGSGEWIGRGIGQGIESHLRFLPERQTDFIFASFSEELGFLGGAPVILLYGALVLFCVYVGQAAQTFAESAFCYLTATMIAVQAGINIGMNMGLVPITGITLPFFSYGGSSILALCFQLGCVQSIVLAYRKKPGLVVR